MSTTRKVKRVDLHRSKVFGGAKEGAERAHVTALGQRCMTCGDAAAVTIRMFCPQNELRAGQLAALIVLYPDGKIPVHTTPRGERFVGVGQAVASRRCQPAAEKVAARHPSSRVVDIDRGPSPDKPQMLVGG